MDLPQACLRARPGGAKECSLGWSEEKPVDADIIVPLTAKDIRALRESAHVSQSVLAKYLNLTVDHVSKLERGAVRPTGAVLAMANLIRRKGIEAIF